MKKIVLGLMLFAGSYAFGEEKNCIVKGMHCSGCKEMVEGKVCDETKYSTCAVSIKDPKKEIGAIHLVTKEPTAKINIEELDKQVKAASDKYHLDCSAPKATKKSKKA